MTSIRDIALYGYQRRWIADRSRFKIGMWSRQVGKTFSTTLEMADDMAGGVVEARPAKWLMLSRGERQSKENLRQLIAHIKGYDVAFRELEADVSFGDEVYKSYEVRIADDIWCLALPASPDTARGYSANVYLDEFAIHKDSREIWGALFPVTSAGFKLRITSTAKGKANKFHELMTSADGRWSRHTVTIHDAVRDGLPRDVDEMREGLADEDLWAQEYECQWLDEASAWLPYDLITAVEDEKAGRPELYQGGPCYLGNDIAARNDLWVTWVLEEVGDVLWTREVRILKRAKFAEHDAVMDELFGRYRVARLSMDQTGMGEKPVEDAKRRYGESRVEGVLFTPGNKLVLATAGKQAFEDRRIRIPAGDIRLRADLHKLKKILGPTGTPRFVADSDAGGHADRAWSCFLAVNGATDNVPSYAYDSAPPKSDPRFHERAPEDDEPAGLRRSFGRGAY
ncbi:Mu-like prophage FluMu protein gp28 [Tistlia consotensis]|uniref:Mu-like prophage FluMu protein gp28 n=1 Tax=Tistlia consotensis USBA 355 TaxID=560819 RepID=A0A1Y6CRJ7_9PROT|nr:terminase family protein [Tistlia consotensis]SMF82988.1 Mu-like prophage FluMu protein gp28 [Tistlia consotensis USBA 355]SNS31701.1 Mu-like prophage FluMu protein gp28 [Tistlia consotensis]